MGSMHRHSGCINAQQNFQFNSGISEGESVPLTYNGNTVSFTYTANVANLIANMTTVLTSLVGTGNFTVTPTNYTSAAETSELSLFATAWVTPRQT